MRRRSMDISNTIFKAAYESVLPNRLVYNAISIDSNRLRLNDDPKRWYQLDKNVYVAAFGKAACGMSRSAEDILHDHIVDGVVSMPKGTVDLFRKQNLKDMLPRADTVLRYYEGAVHNLPDEDSHRAALEIKAMVERMSEEDLLLVLMSGGGSALLPCPPPEIKLDEKSAIIRFLSRRGADIGELNTVRRHLSQLKGGRMAQLAFQRSVRVLSLMISDAIDDPLEIIASGPTAPRKTKAVDAAAIIRKYKDGGDEKLENTLDKIVGYLDTVQEQEDMAAYDQVQNVIIGNNRTALDAARKEAQKYSYSTELVTNPITGEARTIGRKFAQQLHDILSTTKHGKRCWIWGGETTVRVQGSGRGGRNQEMVLAFSLESFNSKLTDRYPNAKFAFLSAGTDGQDGPTDAAGAMIDSDQLKSMNDQDIEMMKGCLESNDSYSFFDRFRNGWCHVKCGLTGTNVMDVQIMIID